MNDTKERETLLNIIADAQTLSDLRNTYAHAVWATAEGDALALIHGTPPSNYRKRYKPTEEITAAKLRADDEKVDALLGRLEDFLLNILPEIPIRLRPHE